MPKYFLRYRDPQKKGEFLQGLGGVAAAGSFLPEHDDQVLIADLAPESVALQSAAGAEIFDDIKFDFNAGAPVPATLPLNATLGARPRKDRTGRNPGEPRDRFMMIQTPRSCEKSALVA
jgi:hypothetical protein